MELISFETHPLEIQPQQLLLARVKRSLELISPQAHLVSSQGKTCCFLVLLKQKKKQEHKLWAHWQVTINKFVQIQVSLSDQQQQFLQPDPSIIITEFVTKINRESILGTYFNNSEKINLIHFRHTFPVQMNKKFVSGTISEIYMQVSEQFWKWVVKLRLLGGQQKVKSIKIFSCLKKIRYMKQYFQHERLNRPKALKTYNLKNSSIKIVEQAIRAVGYQPNLLNNYKANQLDRNQYLLYKMEYQNILKQLANRPNNQDHSPIMQGIQIRQTINQKKFDQGGYSEIFRGEYIAGVTATIFNYGVTHCSSHLSEVSSISEQNGESKMQDCESFSEQNFSRRLLVKKVMKSCMKEVDSFKNQINLLIFIRNDKEERIAGYYMQTHNEHDSLFMQLYQNNLYVASNAWNQKQLLHATKQIIEGIAYLHRRNIVHRDIKELNILIDRHNQVKIIDFGSACAINHETPFPGSYVAINNDLHSTPNYYFPYNLIVNQYPGIKKKYTREQYNQAATFDIFSVGTVMYNLFRLQQGFDSIFYRELTYLADKCHQKNPQDRLLPKQAECFIHLLLELFRLENEQDKKASIKSWSESEDAVVLPKQLFKQE